MTRFRFEQSLRSERRAFATIVTLLVTLNVFFVPSIVVHVISLNAPDVTLLSNGAVIYFMNMLPYFKYASDPIIYGLRMRELQWCFAGSRGVRGGDCCGPRVKEIEHLVEEERGEKRTSLYCMTSLTVNVSDDL